MSDNFSELWPRQLRQDMLAKREHAAKSLAALKNRDSEFTHAHELMLRLYDAALAGIDRQLAMESAKGRDGYMGKNSPVGTDG